MHTIEVDNVNQAIHHGTKHLVEKGIPWESRGMKVLTAPGPVATVYRNPGQCVLFHPVRKPNPFFHLFEALWIIAGDNGAPFLTQFNSNMAQFADESGRFFHGAYGHRLQSRVSGDQFHLVKKLFKEDPNTRRAVLQIWSAGLDLGTSSKDIPCNDFIFLSNRQGRLDITVGCRSNDMIWGAYGANAVQFGVLHVYLAAMLGMPVGKYNQFSQDFHVYTENSQGPAQKELWEALMEHEGNVSNPSNPYSLDEPGTPLVRASLHIEDPEAFHLDCEWLVSNFHSEEQVYRSDFFYNVVREMRWMWLLWKESDKETLEGLHATYEKLQWHMSVNHNYLSMDWLVAGAQWIFSRIEARSIKLGEKS